MVHSVCCVLLPTGRTTRSDGNPVDFDSVYADLVAPGVERAGLEPYRVAPHDAEGLPRRSALEALLLAEHAVADLTVASAALFHRLGVRDALRRVGTVLIAPIGHAHAFSLAPTEILPYALSPDGAPTEVGAARQALTQRLRGAVDAAPDVPLLQLLERPARPDIERTATDVFRERVSYDPMLKDRLRVAREARDLGALRSIEGELGDLRECEAGVLVDLFLSYRAVEAFDDMLALTDGMPAPLARCVTVEEQRAFALNRVGEQEQAARALEALIARRGPSSETCGLLGRVQKDRWEAAKKLGDERLAAVRLDEAIETYRQGFEADWRDAYPGINAATLMELREPPDPRRETLAPAVVYAVERRIAAGTPDFWDHATLVEAAVLARDRDRAESALAHALGAVREVWEPRTTARNLRLIREAREARGERLLWADEIEQALERKALTLE